MESIDIEILTFISPHLFYVTTDVDIEHRTIFLKNLSARIKKSILGPIIGVHEEPFLKEEIVAVYYKSDLVRASVLEKITREENQEVLYSCWLVDYAVLVKSNEVFRLPKEIQKMTPRSRQASLNNICYVREHLELGVTGVIKTVPSILPSTGVTQHSLELLSGCDKLTFEVAERFSNIMIGEVVIHKNGTTVRLTEQLCEKGLVMINELMFQNLKCSTQEYFKTHLNTIYQVCKTPEKPASRVSSPVGNFVEEHIEWQTNELDVVSSSPLENGRRRRPLSNRVASSHSESSSGVVERTEKEQHLENQEPNLSPNNQTGGDASLSRSARLLQKLKAKKSMEASEKEDLDKSGTKTSCDDIWKKVAELKRRKQQRTSSGSINSEEANKSTNDSSSITDEPTGTEKSENNEIGEEKTSNVSGNEAAASPFASITSQRTEKPKVVLVPAGMERSSRIAEAKESTPPKKASKYVKVKTPKPQPEPIPKLTEDGDCPTIKVPNISNSLTDDQVSAEEVEGSSAHREESTSSDSVKSQIFTKQDFCRLVAGCTCVKCRLTLEDDDWEAPIKFESADNETKKVSGSTDIFIKPSKLLKTDAQDNEINRQNEILSINYSGMSFMEKKTSCKVLVNGESIPNPIRHVAKVNIHEEIHKNISKINYKESKRIQHYAFPAITRNQHIFMVNDSNSGKTMAYLPILMSFIMEKEERYSQLFKMGGGPIVVILASNSKKCEEIHDLMRLVLDRQNRKFSLVTYPGYGNISNVDILITMPTVLTTLISTRATNFKRLCHLVLEDADVILKSYNGLIEKFLNYADQVLEHRNCPKSIQLILCAQHWTVEMEDILTKLNKVPMVCIGNYLEAALYGKMKFTMKFLDSGCKEQNLQRILQDKFKFTKSVVICSPDELEDVQTFLTLKGIEFTFFVEVNQKKEDIWFLEAVWNNAVPGRYSVMVCTDDIYNTMHITSAHLLVHFSLPRSWSQFIRRFSCLLENIQTPLNVDQKKIEISCFVFIDENCEARMSKFGNFLKIAGLERELPEKIKAFFQGVNQEEELKRIARVADICQTLKIFGKCDSLYCRSRHILDKNLDSSDILPQNGSIKFKILKMTGAASCSIKLLEHFDLNGQSVRKFEDLTDHIVDALARPSDYQPINKAKIAHLYLHKDKDQYFRCKLVELDDFALLFLIDRGIYCKSDTSKLYKMSEELRKIPPQCVEVHFGNFIPPFEDNRFSRMAGRKAQFLVDSNCPDSVMTGTVLLQLGNNLWVEDVCEYRKMHDRTLPTVGFQLTRELIKQGLAIKSSKPLDELYSLCDKADIKLPEYKIVKTAVRKVSVHQVQPNWAFFDINEIHEVTFTFASAPDEFYVRQNKFNKQLSELEEAIQKQIRKPFYPTPKKIEEGKCYLVKDQVTGAYARGMVLSIEEERAEILCVDYGDVVIDSLSNLKHISNDLIAKLPFQSIQCSMYGIKPIDGDWTDAATDLLYTMAYEEGTGILRSLFIKVNEKQDNSLVKRQHSYSVTLKDGLKRRVLINDLLIDCGFAIPSGEEIPDFDLPDVKTQVDDDSVEEIERSDDDDCDQGPLNNTVNGEPTDFDALEFDTFGLDDFVDTFVPILKIFRSKATGGERPQTSGLPAIKAAPKVDYLTPEVYWFDTDQTVKLDIKISDVVSAKMAVKHNRIFQFSTTKEGKKYALNLLLFAKVDTAFQSTILGSQIRLTLKKCKAAQWTRLLHTQEKVRKIYYDISAMNLADDDEEPVRYRPLQLNISDSSSDEEDDKDPYFVCSDLDSDYDFDIPNDDQ